MRRKTSKTLTLSIYVTTRGYAFAVFEDPLLAVNWGAKEVRGCKKRDRCLAAVCKLLDEYQPDWVVIEEWRARHCRRALRIRQLYRLIERQAVRRDLAIARYRRQEVISCFQEMGAHTKHQRALRIAEQVTAFAYKVPPKRQLWTSEHPRMGIFEAASLNLTHYHRSIT